jgi:hypothetical protein
MTLSGVSRIGRPPGPVSVAIDPFRQLRRVIDELNQNPLT